MSYLEVEEKLARESIIYTFNPGPKEVNRLREYYDVEVISEDQIKITYKK